MKLLSPFWSLFWSLASSPPSFFMRFDLLPIEPNFRQIIKVLVLLIAVLIILLRALPLLGVAV